MGSPKDVDLNGLEDRHEVEARSKPRLGGTVSNRDIDVLDIVVVFVKAVRRSVLGQW